MENKREELYKSRGIFENYMNLSYESSNKFKFPESFKDQNISIKKYYNLDAFSLEDSLKHFVDEVLRIEKIHSLENNNIVNSKIDDKISYQGIIIDLKDGE